MTEISGIRNGTHLFWPTVSNLKAHIAATERGISQTELFLADQKGYLEFMQMLLKSQERKDGEPK